MESSYQNTFTFHEKPIWKSLIKFVKILTDGISCYVNFEEKQARCIIEQDNRLFELKINLKKY